MVARLSLEHRIIAVLADGQRRSIDALAQASESVPAECQAALTELIRAGLTLVREGDGVGLPSAFIALEAQRIGELCAARGTPVAAEVMAMAPSTNTLLMQRTRTGLAHGLPLVLATELQTAGRGRQGRSWQSSAGTSLAVSFALGINAPLAALSGLSLVCGLAVREALSRLGVAATLKWPNDILVDGKKVAGILVEVHGLSTTRAIAVVGVGINVAYDRARAAILSPSDAATPAGERAPLAVTDLESAGAAMPLDRNVLIADIAQGLIERMVPFTAAGFGAFTSDWNAVHAYQDCAVTLFDGANSPPTVTRGVARGVDRSGRLLLDTLQGREVIVAGDISLRSA